MASWPFVWRPGPKVLVATALLALVLAPAAAPHINNNFDVIVKGEAYRSAQPSAEDIRAYARDHGIATIINLRGANPGAPWYDEEVNTANALGIGHIDFGISANRKLTSTQVTTLVRLLNQAPKPLLIHCLAGADRTGLASALYVAGVAGLDEASAEQQLSLRYGHYAIPVLGTWAMDQTWENVEPVFGFKAERHGLRSILRNLKEQPN